MKDLRNKASGKPGKVFWSASGVQHRKEVGRLVTLTEESIVICSSTKHLKMNVYAIPKVQNLKLKC